MPSVCLVTGENLFELICHLSSVIMGAACHIAMGGPVMTLSVPPQFCPMHKFFVLVKVAGFCPRIAGFCPRIKNS